MKQCLYQQLTPSMSFVLDVLPIYHNLAANYSPFMEVVSPVSASQNTSIIEEFDVVRIVKLYNRLGIDVSRFFNKIEKIYLYQCNDSLYRFYYPFSVFGDDQFYQELYSKIPNYYYPQRWEYDYTLSKIKPGSNVLEIGSGAGIFLEKLKSHGCRATGLELNSKAISDCQKKGLDVKAELIEPYSSNSPCLYDVVCSFQVLEHVTNVKSFIESAIQTLKPGGNLIISVPNSNPFFHKHDKYHTLNLPPHHSGLWNKSSLENLTAFFPLRLESIKSEPLKEYKDWYLVQQDHYRKAKPWLGKMMSLVPRPIYKKIIQLFSPLIEGAYITANYQKKNDK